MSESFDEHTPEGSENWHPDIKKSFITEEGPDLGKMKADSIDTELAVAIEDEVRSRPGIANIKDPAEKLAKINETVDRTLKMYMTETVDSKAQVDDLMGKNEYTGRERSDFKAQYDGLQKQAKAQREDKAA